MKTIQLKKTAKGEIILGEDKVVLNDICARTNKFFYLLFPCLFFIIGIILLYVAIMDNDDFQMALKMVSGILFLMVPALIYNSNLKRTNKREILFSEIKKVDLKYIFGQMYIDFHLKNNVTRSVYNIRDYDDWEAMRDFLLKKHIPVFNE